ncbi:PREDICTED: uncharacterized protein LOC105363859 isoform X2 [Ceratosolen solmsi marchali]|uniref:Uncharacterized protein LOC105363859 isoform X2 n=1 Tax=Ceratosolen solmsi marchali TaxID=326594 RepID=A0AAJ6YKZ9_9HYME|nr:PREDICTED: uncharacterized protein LOC105363859 isoform X2 [Ceratosolen solmsi marchali]
MAETLISIACFIDPIIAILLSIILLPTLVVSYLVCQWSKRCWVRFIKWKYPNCIIVEESNTRSILDQGRNQGIYTLLVECPSLVTEHLRNHLVHLASTKPLLRMALTTKCYRYAWEKLENFSVDNHLIVSSNSFKGRPITESNVQEYVSDLTSKYLAASHSPWQVQVIGRDQQLNRHYLVRVHHLLLHQAHLVLGDFLPLNHTHWLCADTREPILGSPFTSIYAEISALPRLQEELAENFSNVWNEFLCNNDPIERTEILKKRITLWHCAKITVIVCFSTLKEFIRQYKRKESLRLRELWQMYEHEAQKRNFSWSVVFNALFNLLNPIENLRLIITWIWYFLISASIKAPIMLWREIRTAILLHKHNYYSDSVVSTLSYYLPLLFRASLEVISILVIIVNAPFAIVRELFSNRDNANFRTVSQSGRKVVAWSEEIEIAFLQKMSTLNGASVTENLLAAAVDSLKEYFRYSGQSIPNEILATANFTSQKTLYVSDSDATGLLCLALPTKTPLLKESNNLIGILQRNVEEARRKQRAIYAITAAETASGFLTSCLPSILLKIVLNHLTRRYSISITHVDGDLPVEGLQSAIFWKPPQGNCNLSITLHRHGKTVRLGVMGDAIIGPQHAAITRGFPASLEKLAQSLGLSTPSSRSSNTYVSSSVTSSSY